MKLFISYRRANWSFTYWLAEELGKLLDAEIFVDFSGIDDSDFESSLLRNLRESDAVILVVTEQTFEAGRIHNDRDWVRREIREALRAKKPIVLAMVNGLIPPPDIPDDIQAIRGKQGIEFYPRFFKAGVQEMAVFLDRATPIKLRSNIVATPDPLPAISPTTSTSDKTLYERAVSLFEASKYDDAIPIFDILIANQYKADVSIKHLREKAIENREQEQRRWEAGQIYDRLAAAFQSMPIDVAEGYAEFRITFPEFTEDPAELATRIATWQVEQERINLPVPAETTAPIVKMQPRWVSFVRTRKRALLLILIGALIAFGISKITPSRNIIRVAVRDLSLVFVPSGCFQMGSDQSSDEKPSHEVCLTKNYYIGEFEVTNAQFAAYEKATGKTRANVTDDCKKVSSADNQPVVCVTWTEADAYARWLGNSCQLPSEAQWEYAARSPASWVYPWGDTLDKTKANTYDAGLGKTSPVGSYSSGQSWVGAQDMAGNVWEWVNDWYDGSYYASRPKPDNDPTGPMSGSSRALRGGAWVNLAGDARAASRLNYFPAYRSGSFGFRVVCSAPVL